MGLRIASSLGAFVLAHFGSDDPSLSRCGEGEASREERSYTSASLRRAF